MKTKDEIEREARKVRDDTRGLRLRLLELKAAQAKGDKGERGEPGPIGPMPTHEWRALDDGTIELRFEIAPGVWGEWSENLRGPRGFPGGGHGGVSVGVKGDKGDKGDPGTGTGTGDIGFPRRIPVNTTYTVPIDRCLLATGIIEVNGDLVLDGELEFIAG